MPRIAKFGALGALTAATSMLALVGCGTASTQAQAQAQTQTQTQTRLPTKFGVVLSTTANWNQQRSFANLAAVGDWMSAGPNGWNAMDHARTTQYHAPASLAANEKGILTLATPPGAQFRDVPIRCTFEGHGTVEIFLGSSPFVAGNHADFTWGKGGGASVVVATTDPKDPIRNIDCRERSMPRDALFDPDFVKSLRPFTALRFLDWQRANEVNVVTWATRTQPDAAQDGPDGVAVENLIALANLVHADPWFCMPWNADEDYLRKFAAYAHDHLDPGLVVYVEAGNEIWNTAFRAAQQAQGEGRARGLSQDDNTARMRQYADRSIVVLDIFAKAFADNPKRLVRVMSGMAWVPDMLRLSLDFRDTPKHIDAIAVAPYFGFDLLSRPGAPVGDIDALFRQLDKDVDSATGMINPNRQLADHYKVRLLAYEAGQHLTTQGPDKTIVARMNRDPRMKAAYDKYLAAWVRDTGDLMMLFGDVSPAGEGGAWGLRERSGQPVADAPKLQAALEAIAKTDQRDRLR